MKKETLRQKIRNLYLAGAKLDFLINHFKHQCEEKYIRVEYTRNTFLHLNKVLPKIQGNFAESKKPYSYNEMDYAPRFEYKLEDLSPVELSLFNDKNHDTLKEPCKI